MRIFMGVIKPLWYADSAESDLEKEILLSHPTTVCKSIHIVNYDQKKPESLPRSGFSRGDGAMHRHGPGKIYQGTCKKNI